MRLEANGGDGEGPAHQRANARRNVHTVRPDFRLTELELAIGEEVGWHRHTSVDDTFYVVEGRIRVSLRDPDEEVFLDRGRCWGSVRHGRVHNVSNADTRPAFVVLLQGFGEYDFQPLE
jgi:mannose-6-phosphate isomerase-like protein (cupin superfamily)